MVKNISEYEWYMSYEDDVLNHEKPVVIIFMADWCESCHKLIDTLNDLEFNVEILAIDVDSSDTLADEMSVTTLPAVVVYEFGEISTTFSNNTAIGDIIAYIREM